MFIAYLWNNDSAARWLIARGLGGIYFLEKILKKWNKITRPTRAWVYILIWNVNFVHKNNVVSQPALAIGLGPLGGVCIMEKKLGKWHIMVSLDVYSYIIIPLKFLISYINIIILQAWKVVRYRSAYWMFRGHVPSREFVKSGTIWWVLVNILI